MPRTPGKPETSIGVLVLTLAVAVPATPSLSLRDVRAGTDDGAAPASAPAPAHGGSPYPHGRVERFEMGEGPRSYWLFEPADPKPDQAPVVVFLHGWFAVNPAFYGAWIDHLVRSGRTVVFPRYQNDVGTLPREFLPNALAAIRDAFDVLDGGARHVRPERDRLALIGHSAGGNLAALIAAAAADPHSGIPSPRLVVALMPGEVLPSREPRLERIPASTLLLIAVGEEDLLVGDLRGRQIFTQTTAIPRSRKRYMLFRSDRRGVPPIVAEHTAPTGVNRRLDTGEGILRGFQLSLGEVNAMDRAGFWKSADLALDAAFHGRNFDEAIADPAHFTHLGYWNDGRKVNPPLISDDIATVPRVALPNGIRMIPWDLSPKLGETAKTESGTRLR